MNYMKSFVRVSSSCLQELSDIKGLFINVLIIFFFKFPKENVLNNERIFIKDSGLNVILETYLS